MIGWLKPAPLAAPLPASEVDPTYRKLRRQVFGGIFIGYAAYYLVRNNLALAIPDILKEFPEHSKAELGTALTGSSIAYGVSKFLMGSVSDRSNPRWFMTLGLLLTSAVTFAFGAFPAIYGSLFLIVALQTLNGWFNATPARHAQFVALHGDALLGLDQHRALAGLPRARPAEDHAVGHEVVAPADDAAQLPEKMGE